MKLKTLTLSLLTLMLGACSTTPAPSIYKGAQEPRPVAPKPNPDEPVVRTLSAPGFKETPLEAKPLPAKPLNGYAPSVTAPSAPMTPGVDYAQNSASAGTTLATQQVNKVASQGAQQVAASQQQANTQIAQLGQQVNAGKQLASVALPAAAPSGSAAVRELASQAEVAMGKGDLTASAATLERALRIEPNNAGLWSRLAEVRLRQGDLAQAEQLALKSNGLAATDASLRARNDSIVSQARGR